MLKYNSSVKYIFNHISKLNTNLLKKHKIFHHSNSFSHTTRDDKFWEEYSKRKAQGGKYPALESQEIIYNKVIHSWKFSDKHSFTPEEFLICLRDLKSEPICPFFILDVREESEYDLYKFPLRTKDGSLIPVIYRTMEELNYGNFTGIAMDKYVICIDSLGLRARMAARNLNGEGYLSIYVEGGYDMFLSILKDKEI